MGTRIKLLLLLFVTLSTQSYSQELDEALYDKVLGAIVGSAMGDALGASTEMWSRDDRDDKYGYITNLTAPEIQPSAEGVWASGYPAGATTDDTRWKELVANYMIQELSNGSNTFNPTNFANHILNYANNIDSEDALSDMRSNWIKEWAEVSEAYISNDIDTYNIALSRFYGGDLLCAGMLYAPLFGVAYANDPASAYESSFKLALFDQGYAKDITALSAAMTAVAMNPNNSTSDMLEVFYSIDPYQFSDRRIFQRTTTQTLEIAQFIVDQSMESEQPELKAWELLDQRNQQVAPHAQEILLISLTAMIFADFDFQTSLEFMVNYGRDNDTTAAYVGTILGAFHGYESLPSYKSEVIKVAEEIHRIPLIEIAKQLTLSIQQK